MGGIKRRMDIVKEWVCIELNCKNLLEEKLKTMVSNNKSYKIWRMKLEKEITEDGIQQEWNMNKEEDL